MSRVAKEGPLSEKALERVAKGVNKAGPGYVYILNEKAGVGSGRADHSTIITEWKVGFTINLESRMKTIATKNSKAYELRAFWEVPWPHYVEQIAHADLKDFQLPKKIKQGRDGTKETEEGGTEWFGAGADIGSSRPGWSLRSWQL